MNMEDKISIMPSIWASIYSWLTPILLFLVLNFTIGVIALTSNLTPKKNPDHSKNHLRLVGKSPVLTHTLKSADPNPPVSSDSTYGHINPSETTTHFDLRHQNDKFPQEPETQFVETEQSLEETHASSPEMEQTRDTDGGKKEREAPQKELSKTLDEIFSPLQTESEFARKPRPRQSGDVKSGFAQLEENAAAVEDEDEDEGVDAKADDFINKFKEQLKLQRIESWRRSNGWTIDEGV